MVDLRRTVILVLSVGLLAGCTSSAPSVAPPPAVSATAVPAATLGQPSPARSAPSQTSTAAVPMPGGDVPLEPGTYRLAGSAVGPAFPSIDVTVPGGWTGGEWYLTRPRLGISFWDVDQVYGHPCQWRGSLSDPGPRAADLAAALAEVPMRATTKPVAVTLSGYTGKYLEWSVPADLPVEADSNFPDCDATVEGNRDFNSWTGRGMGKDRYQQAPGQVDHLWILDVGESRLVIDAFELADATDADRIELKQIVESIRIGA